MRRSTLVSLGLVLAPLLWAAAARSGWADEPEDFTSEPIRGRSFVDGSHEGADFRGADATEADFTRARLAGARFNGTILTRAVLSDADLTGADLSQATPTNARMGGTDLTRAKLTGVDLTSVLLSRARLREADLRGLLGLGGCEAVDFRGADLRGANLIGFKDQSAVPSKWRGAKYDRTTKWPQGFNPAAAEVVLYVGDAPKKPPETGDREGRPIPAGRDFRGQDLSNRKFVEEDLSNASLWNVDCNDAELRRVRLIGADLSGVDLSGAKLLECDLTGADLRRALLRATTFEGTDLSKADLRAVDLSAAHVSRCKLLEADLRNLRGLGVVTSGDFSGADLRGANLSSFRDGAVQPYTVFKGARYDKWTRWPAGFDPVGAGAVLVTEGK